MNMHCFCKNYLRTDGKPVLVCCKCNESFRPYELDGENARCDFREIK